MHPFGECHNVPHLRASVWNQHHGCGCQCRCTTGVEGAGGRFSFCSIRSPKCSSGASRYHTSSARYFWESPRCCSTVVLPYTTSHLKRMWRPLTSMSVIRHAHSRQRLAVPRTARIVAGLSLGCQRLCTCSAPAYAVY